MAPAPVDAAQAALTAAHLGDPRRLEEYFGDLRRSVDPDLAVQYPAFGGKPYPLGRCREIRDAVLELLLRRVNDPQSAEDAATAPFLGAGGHGPKVLGGGGETNL